MKAVIFFALAMAACLTLCFTSCTKTSGADQTVGTYTATCDSTKPREAPFRMPPAFS